MKLLGLILLLVAVLLMGCHSQMVHITLINASAEPLATIVVDYPGATFGVNQLASGKTFDYSIKPLGTGPLKIQFSDASGHDHTYTGPEVHKGDQGTIMFRMTQDGVTAQPAIASR